MTMIAYRRNIHFRTVFLLILFSSYGCYACFLYNNTQTKSIKTGSSYYQECHCVEPGHSIHDLKWLDINGMEIDILRPGTQSNVYIEQRDNSLNLYISNITKALSGEYKCVTNHNGRQNVLTYEVKAYDPLYFVNTDELQFLRRGEDSTITCEARGETVPLISWDLGELMLAAMDAAKYEFTLTGLLVRNVTDSDGGTYKCMAFVLDTGEEVDKFIKVEIIATPVIKALKAIPVNTVIEGSLLTIECHAEGTPEPDYMLHKIPDYEISLDQYNVTLQEKKEIVFENIQESDRGTYECIASNKAGEVRSNITIEVLFPPTITEFNNITVVEGKTARLVCKARGRSPPEIQILFEGESLDVEQRTVSDIENEASLLISETNHTHLGFYACNASNEVAYQTDEIYLDILYKPYFETPNEIIWGWKDKNVNLSCENDSNPPSNTTLRYLENEMPKTGQDQIQFLMPSDNDTTEQYINIVIDDDVKYGLYECIAKNSLGEARKIITLKKAFPPPVVQNVTIIDLKASSALFEIEGPVNFDGPQIIGYTAQYDDSVNYNFSYAHINRTWALGRPYKIEKLKPSYNYYVKFSAINEAGVGNWTEVIEFTTPNKSAPEKPNWIDDLPKNANKQQALRWSVPESNGDPIDHYLIEYCPELNVDSKHEPICKRLEINPATQVELNFLDYNLTYYLKLFAHNSEGYSDPLDKYIFMKESEEILPSPEEESKTLLSMGALIGIIIVVVFICLVLLDLLLLCCKRKGIIAKCCYRNNKKRKENRSSSRDKKGLLKDNTEVSTEDTLKRSSNGHKEFEYNKTTGIITGKHSAV